MIQGLPEKTDTALVRACDMPVPCHKLHCSRSVGGLLLSLTYSGFTLRVVIALIIEVWACRPHPVFITVLINVIGVIIIIRGIYGLELQSQFCKY